MKKYLAMTLLVLGISVVSLPASAFFGDCCYCNYYTPVVYYNYNWGCDYCY